MGRILKYVGYMLYLPVWWIQYLIPRNSKTWVFGAWYGKRYSDNSKYLFEYVTQHHPEIKAIWVSREKEIVSFIRARGQRAYMVNSIKGALLCLVAKYVIVSSGKRDVNHMFVNGAVSLQLWHGNPMKMIGLDDKYSTVHSFNYQVLMRYLFPMGYEFDYDYVVSNAPVFTDKMMSAFNVSRNQIMETGCPRNDVFFQKDLAAENLRIKEKFPGVRLVYYLPTFRDNSPVHSMLDLASYDEGELQRFLEKENMVFMTKAHFAAKPVASSAAPNNRIVHLKDDKLVDINFLLKDADILITDYSGAYFDFLLTQRPIIFAAFDLQEYLSQSRQLYFDYKETVAGPIVEDWPSLFKALKQIKSTSDVYNLELNKKNNIFNKFHDAHNSHRVSDAIIKLGK